MVIRTSAHNKRIAEGLMAYHRKVRSQLGTAKYFSGLGQAARYRNLAKEGKPTKKQIEVRARGQQKARKKTAKTAKKKGKAKKPTRYVSEDLEDDLEAEMREEQEEADRQAALFKKEAAAMARAQKKKNKKK